jgi:TolB protein
LHRRILLGVLALAVGLLLWTSFLGRADAPSESPEAGIPSPAPVVEIPPWQSGLIAVDIATESGRAIVLYDAAAGASAPPRLLVDGLDAVAGLDWSPDGSWLAYGARLADNWDIYAVPRQGGPSLRLTTDPGFDGHPAWSPDGKQLAFESGRDGPLAIYGKAWEEPSASGTEAAQDANVRPIGPSGGIAIEPEWAPAGKGLVAAVWVDGRFRLETWAGEASGHAAIVDSSPKSTRTDPESPAVKSPPGRAADPARLYRNDEGDAGFEDDAGFEGDARLPKISPKGDRWALLGLSGSQRILRLADWPASESEAAGASRTLAVSASVLSYDWSPEGGALAILTQGRGGNELQIVAADNSVRQHVASLPSQSASLAWADGAMPTNLLALASAPASLPAARASADPELRSGLERLAGVDTPGPRLNAALVDDFETLRAELRADLGVDFLARLSDAWRSLGATESSFFSWHKTGRAFDIAQEYRSLDGGTGMVIVAEPIGGRPFWRIYLRAGKQDGSVGAPLREAGWDFYARHSGDPVAERAGGQRRTRIPAGYYVDFTAMAAAHGFQRIPALTSRGSDWRDTWSSIEFWHFERRDGLSWYAAARQAYPDEVLVAELNADRLKQLGQAGRGFGRVGIPRNLGRMPGQPDS